MTTPTRTTTTTSENLLARAGDQLSVRRVFGEPVEHDGIVVIPVAVAVGGGGGGTGPEDQGTGAGVGGMVRGIGVYSIADGKVRYIPAVDTSALAVIALILARSLLRARRRRLTRTWASGAGRATRRRSGRGSSPRSARRAR